jgi:hypothetical protein
VAFPAPGASGRVFNAVAHLRAVPNLRPLRVLLIRLGIIVLVFSLQRMLFVLLNAAAFPDPPASVFIGGIRFDLSAIAWLFLPWSVAFILKPCPGPRFARVQKGFFHLSSAVCFFLNCIDLEYYKFTLKRSTADLFGIATGGNDMAHLAPLFVVDYWYVVLAFLASMAIAVLGYRWTARTGGNESSRPWWAWRAMAIAIIVLLGRGGLQYIPLGVLDAGKYAPPAYMAAVLNTPFTFMTSIGKPMVQEKHYMPQAEAERLWPVVHHYGNDTVNSTRPNVVVIILESFSAAYSGRLNGTGQGYMPFLDSLMGQSLWFDHAYANGRRSIDGIPAVVASLPSMMDQAFIESPYAQQPFTSLPGLLAKEGYSSAFFHGGHNGTMGFDAFAKAAGFQRYVGRDEYPDPKDDDGTWGIRDRPFLQFFAHELNKQQQPFVDCLFTLSSHHPYKLPPTEAKRFAGGELAIMPTLRYADDALRQFFATARTMPWFGNTLFVITADHTADLLRNGETNGTAYDHWVPLLYYMPAAIPPEHEGRITQQIDILPTVLDMIGYQKPFVAFGSSVLRNERLPAAVCKSGATWLIVSGGCQLLSDGEHALWSAGTDKETAAPAACADGALPILQAAIQQYNNRLLHHELVWKGR